MNRYKEFFDSPDGVKLLQALDILIDQNHIQAEDQPELSRDCMQRAKGNREAISLIKSYCTDIKKGKTEEETVDKL